MEQWVSGSAGGTTQYLPWYYHKFDGMGDERALASIDDLDHGPLAVRIRTYGCRLSRV